MEISEYLITGHLTHRRLVSMVDSDSVMIKLTLALQSVCSCCQKEWRKQGEVIVMGKGKSQEKKRENINVMFS